MCPQESSGSERSVLATAVSDSDTPAARSLDGDPDEPVPMPRGTPEEPGSSADEAVGLVDRLDAAVRRVGRHVHDSYPSLDRHLLFARSLYADAYVRASQARYNRRHAAPIDPYRVVWVDPDRVVRLSQPSSRSRFRRVGTVAGGDWDRCAIRFRDTDVFAAFRRHFLDDVPWEETAFFDRIVGEIEAGDERWGCASAAAFRRRCERLDRLYATIREHGFHSQRELLESGVEDPIERRRTTVSARVINDEIAVDVGRNGELLFADGRNRLAIAKLLDVDRIPVLVFRRHAQWVTLRDATARFVARGGTLPDRLRDHPDIAPIVE